MPAPAPGARRRSRRHPAPRPPRAPWRCPPAPPESRRAERDVHRGRALREPRGVRGGAADARGERQEDEGEPRADLARLGGHDGAARALVEVRLEAGGVAAAEPAAGVAAEPVDRPTALGLVVGVAQVRPDPRLAESLACTIGEGRRRVRAHADAAGRPAAAPCPRPRSTRAPPASGWAASGTPAPWWTGRARRAWRTRSWTDPRTTRGSRGSSPGARDPSSPRCSGSS